MDGRAPCNEGAHACLQVLPLGLEMGGWASRPNRVGNVEWVMYPPVLSYPTRAGGGW